MGGLVGHVAPGCAFMALGLWHLLNHIKRHSLQPNFYRSSPWFPTSKIRYLELFFILIACFISISMELFISPRKHHPFDTDGTIPSYHLHNLEHATISLNFFTYAALAIVLDKTCSKIQHGLTYFVGAIAFGQELLLFHLHSADHMGVEGQYHLLLQLVILVCSITTLMGIGLPKSFLLSFVRSASIFFQGAWLLIMGYMLWTPELVPKGCFINFEVGHQVVRCHGEEALHRAKALVNIQFCWYVIGATIFSVCLYLVLDKTYGEKVEYSTLRNKEDPDSNDVELQQKHKFGGY